MSESATATLNSVSNGPGSFSYTVTLTNTGTAPIGIFWFAWDDLPDQDFMTQVPAITGSPAGWVATTTFHVYPGGAGYGIEWYTFNNANRLPAGSTTTTFTFNSAETPAQMAALSPFDPTFQTTASFVYQSATLTPPPTDPGFSFTAAVACFCAGTRIATPDGEAAIETLKAGDTVMTASGTHRRVVWTGMRRVDCQTHPAPHRVWPVRVSAGALGSGSPRADLYLSPDHALFVDGVLVPVKYLIDGLAIASVPVEDVIYHHIELDAHDVLLAEGAPAESYLDTGDRAKFGGSVVNAACIDPAPPREANAHAPLIVTGPKLAAIRRRLRAARAGDSHSRAARPERISTALVLAANRF